MERILTEDVGQVALLQADPPCFSPAPWPGIFHGPPAPARAIAGLPR